MDAKDIPQVIVDLLDERAGKKHSRDGVVLTTLAEILTMYDEIIFDRKIHGRWLEVPEEKIRSVGIIGHPNSGKTELKNGVLGLDETPIIPITADEVIIFLD